MFGIHRGSSCLCIYIPPTFGCTVTSGIEIWLRKCHTMNIYQISFWEIRLLNTKQIGNSFEVLSFGIQQSESNFQGSPSGHIDFSHPLNRSGKSCWVDQNNKKPWDFWECFQTCLKYINQGHFCFQGIRMLILCINLKPLQWDKASVLISASLVHYLDISAAYLWLKSMINNLRFWKQSSGSTEVSGTSAIEAVSEVTCQPNIYLLCMVFTWLT